MNLIRKYLRCICYLILRASSTGGKWDKYLVAAILFELREQKIPSSEEALTIDTEADADNTAMRRWIINSVPRNSGVWIQLSSGSGNSVNFYLTAHDKDIIICGRDHEPRSHTEVEAWLEVCHWSDFIRLCFDVTTSTSTRIETQSRTRHKMLVE